MAMGTENAQGFVSDFGNAFNAKPAWPRDIPPHKTQEMETNPSESTSYSMVRNPPRPLDNWGQRVNEAYNHSKEKHQGAVVQRQGGNITARNKTGAVS